MAAVAGACGECRWAVEHGTRKRTFYKCAQATVTKGPATDIRLSWPGCTAFEETDVDRRWKWPGKR